MARTSRGPSVAYSGYARRRRTHRAELQAMITETASLGHDPSDTAELLELLRELIHVEIDRMVDEEALRHPSPRRLIFRAPRYRESA